jgi:hypothetical protein
MSRNGNVAPISYGELQGFELDCGHREEQIEFLEDQIRSRTLYRVDGIEGSIYPNRINKQFFSLARDKIWTLRLSCLGSRVDKVTQSKFKDVLITSRPPEAPRCYFEEKTEVTGRLKLDPDSSREGGVGGREELVTRKKEICTTFPLLGDSKILKIGDLVDLDRDFVGNISYKQHLRKWNGNLFQRVTTNELHRSEVVRITLVLMWSNKGFVVVDRY